MESAERTRRSLKDAGLAAGPLKETGTIRVTMKELLDRLENHYKQNGQDNPKNLNLLKKAKAAFGKYAADDLTKDHGDAYIARMREKEKVPAKATINRVLQIVSRALTLAGRVSPLPRLSEKDNVRTGFFSPAEFRAVLSHLPNDGLRDFVLYAYLCGWRKGSIASLRWSDVDIEAGEINLPGEFTKNGEPLKMSTEGELAEVLARRKEARAVKTEMGATIITEYVFHRGDGQRIGDFKKSWSRATKEAACPGRLFHDLRRTAARELIRSGVPRSVAKKVTGHKTDSMFERYNIINTDDLREAMVSVDAYRKEQQKKVAAMK